MGVPITFIGQWNPEQFEIVGLGDGNLYRDLEGGKGLSKDFVDKYYEDGNTGVLKEGDYKLGYYNKHGEAIRPYMRILIKRRLES